MNRNLILFPYRDEIIGLYKQGYGTYKIAKLYDVSAETVRKFLHREGITLREQSIKNYSKNECAFDDLSKEEVQYWLGFLYADGHISERRHYLKLGIAKKDKDHLLTFKKFLQFDGPIREEVKIIGSKKYLNYSLIIHSQRMIDRLISIGFKSNKTFSEMDLPSELLQSKHFWRGMIDGDGWLTFRTTKNKVKGRFYPIKILLIGLCGHKSTIERFIEFAITIIPTIRYRIREAENYVEIYIGNKKAYLLMDHIYNNSTIYLPRKYEIFLKAKEHYERSEWRVFQRQ